MKLLTTTIARIIFAIPFAVFGIGHLTSADKMAGMIPIPGGAFWVYFTGVALIAASISIISGKLTRVACLSLAVFLAIVIFTMQVPNLSNPQMAQMAFSGLLKDTSLLGGALLIAGLYSEDRDEVFSAKS
jgi:putative oxidoreductase